MRRILRCILVWFRSLFGYNGEQAKLEEEFQFHLDMRIQDLEKGGMPKEAARRAALREFGGVERLKEDCRDAWGTRVVVDLVRDVRYALRNIVSSPGSSLMVAIIMAFGIGISVTMFVFVKGILWSDMGVVSENRLVVAQWDPDHETGGTFPRDIRIADYDDFKERSESFETLVGAVLHGPSFGFSDEDGYPVRYTASSVTWDFFQLLGVPPLLGRTFIEEDVAPGSEKMVILSYRLWKEEFGGDPEILNRTGHIEGRPSRIIGVMPEEFATFPDVQRYWTAVDFGEWGAGQPREQRRTLRVIGYLKEGVTIQNAEAELETIAARLADEYPNSNDKLLGLTVRTYREFLLDGQNDSLLYTLLFCGAMVFFVACANVSNLMLARAAKRSFELALRNSMGASKAHIMYQIFLDGILLTTLGGVGGLLVSYLGSGYLSNAMSVFNMPFWVTIEMDTGSVLLAVGVMILAAFLASLVPALRSARRDSFALMRDDSRTSSSLYMGKLSKALVGIQIALALSLTIVATVMVMTRSTLVAQQTPYESDKIVLTSLWFGYAEGFKTPEDVYTFHRDLKSRMIEQGAIAVGYFIGGGDGLNTRRAAFELFGENYASTTSMPEARVIDVSPDYFEVYGLEKTLAGRLFNEFDVEESQKVAIVNKALARTHFGREYPIGRQIRIPANNGTEAEWLTIIGVVENYVSVPVRGESLSAYATIYRPLKQNFFRFSSVAGKFREDGERWIYPFRREMAKLAPYTATNNVMTLEQRDAFGRQYFDLIIDMFLVFGLVSFVVASVGLYAVISFSTTQRIREFGVRMALGGKFADIIFSVVRGGLIQTVLGLFVGLSLGYYITIVMEGELDLRGMPPVWMSSGMAAILVISAAAIAMFVPAIYAARLEPTKALRY